MPTPDIAAQDPRAISRFAAGTPESVP